MEAAEALVSLGDTSDAQEISGVATQTDLTLSELCDMQKQLEEHKGMIEDLTLQLTRTVAPFSEESLKSDELVKFYTGLPNILQSTLPIHYIIKRDGEECPIIDWIVRACCALCNVCDSVVPFE